jgi:Cu(I)/Ag(I) efflux system membrane fusion protein
VTAILRAGSGQTTLLLPGKTTWVDVAIYEYELDLVRPGQSVEIATPSGPTYAGRVVSIDPILDPATRTARVRVLTDSPDEALRPGAFVDARLHIPLGRVLAIADDAVLDTGEHRIVFVVRDGQRFEPHTITLGRAADGAHEVLAGLDEGDAIVTSANFLIDSESRFRAALAGFAKSHAGH